MKQNYHEEQALIVGLETYFGIYHFHADHEFIDGP